MSEISWIRRRICFVIACLLATALTAAAEPAASAPDIGEQADRILREMSEHLQTAGEFAFHAEVTYDSLTPTGGMIQYGGRADVSVRRPDRLHVEYVGDERQNRFVLDGRTVTVYDAAVNVYAVTEVPADIDAAIDRMVEQYGFSVPIADLVYADPYSTLTGSVDQGSFVGRHAVDGETIYMVVVDPR